MDIAFLSNCQLHSAQLRDDFFQPCPSFISQCAWVYRQMILYLLHLEGKLLESSITFYCEHVMNSFATLMLIAILACGWSPPKAQAQMTNTEEKFQDLFVTAGYGTAFGAAFGAALLSFQAKPEQNLRFIAVGASIGFIGGSLLGSYIAFSPVFVGSTQADRQAIGWQSRKEYGLTIVPALDPDKNYKLAHIEGQWNLYKF